MNSWFKKFLILLLVLIILFFLYWLAGLCSPRSDVEVGSFSPEGGLPGTVVTIEGFGFAPDAHDNIVEIGGSATRIIDGDDNRIRVVALRHLVSGPIKVTTPAGSAASSSEFKRAGTTLRATPLANSDSKLIEGIDYPFDQHYDMAAQGLDQRILVVLVTPSDIDPEDLAPAGQTAREAVLDRLQDANIYFDQASYSLTSADFTVTNSWLPLSQPRDFYAWQQEDVDRAQAGLDAANAALDALALDPSATEADLDAAEEDVDAAQAKVDQASNAKNKIQEPGFFFAEALIAAKAAVADFNSYTDYFVITAGPFLRGANYGTSTGYHAESTNPALMIGPFDIDFTEPKGITYVAQEATWDRMVHELSHFFAGGDLYGESFANGSTIEGAAGPFAMMGNHGSKPLYIGHNIEKRLDYFDEAMGTGNVAKIEWGSTATHDETYDLVPHDLVQNASGNDQLHLLKLKVTEGLTYYAEVRQRPDPGSVGQDYVFDPSIPLDPSAPAWEGGVIIYKAVENNNQSNNKERRVNLLAPQRMLQVGDTFEDPARTIRLDVSQRSADRPANYTVRVRWGTLPAADPNGQFDLRITPWGAPPWETVDIWVNSPKNDETSPAKEIYKNHEPGDDTKPVGNGDAPWVGHDNIIYARITNQGVVDTPEPVRVTFYVNTPPGIGDDGTWAPFDTIDVGILAAGETRIVQAARKWRPSVGEHTCVKVEIHKMTGEVTFDNNGAQENFNDFEAVSASPYNVVEFDFIARNPYEVPAIMDLNARNLPKGWNVAFEHGSLWLEPGANETVHTLIWTDRPVTNNAAETALMEKRRKDQEGRLPPRKVDISLEGEMDVFASGDQSFAIGGITASVGAVVRTEIRVAEFSKQAKREQRLIFSGSLTPNTGVTPLAIHIRGPGGQYIVERLATDASGLFTVQTQFRPELPGDYGARIYVLGGSYAAESESALLTVTVN